MFDLQFFSAMHSQLGLMTWPLTLLSLFMVMIILERSVFALLNTKTSSKSLQKHLYALSLNDDSELEQFVQGHKADKRTLSQGICMLVSHRHFSKILREEAVSIWLHNKRRQYTAGLKLLNIIGVLSPLIGLLGTVLGLIDMFEGLSSSQGSINPSQLADGLGMAMSTTAAGLLIALPAIASAQLFNIWADRTMARIEYVLNHFNLHLAGISFHEPRGRCVQVCASENQCVQSATPNNPDQTRSEAPSSQQAFGLQGSLSRVTA